MGILLLLVSASFLVGTEVFLRRELRVALEADLQATAMALTSQVQGATDRLLTAARIVAEEPRLKAAVNTPGLDQATLDDIAEELRALARWDLLVLTDPDATVLAVAAPGAGQPSIEA